MLRTRISKSLPDAVADRAGRRWERMWATALVAALTCLVPLAHASPSDPVWIAGAYDAADSDDIILKATSLETSVEGGLLPIFLVASFTVLSQITSAVPASTLLGIHARAPPE